NDTPTSEISTLSLHDALPILLASPRARGSCMTDTIHVVVNGASREVPAGTTVAGLLAILGVDRGRVAVERNHDVIPRAEHELVEDRKSTRLNSSHVEISYAVF